MKQSAAQKVAFTGMLFALAIALSMLESWITLFFALPPGVKLGLANIVVMYALLCLSRRHALALVVLKAGFSLFTRGALAGLLSLSGGLLSFAVLALMLLGKKQPSLLLFSIAGALSHNLGQLVFVTLWMGTPFLIYTPILLVSGIGMGLLTSLSLRSLLPPLRRIGLGGENNSS